MENSAGKDGSDDEIQRNKRSDENLVDGPLPRRHGRQLGAVGVDDVPVELAAANIDVDVARAQPRLALPGEADEPEEDDDGEGEVRLEEARCVVVAAAWGADGDVELFLFTQGSDDGFRVERGRGLKLGIAKRRGGNCE